MKTSLLFSSFPFIASEKVTLTRMTELDLNAMWEIMGDDDNYRFAPTAALRSPAECVLKLRQIEALFRDRAAITLGIYPMCRLPPSVSPSTGNAQAWAMPPLLCGPQQNT